MPESRPPVAGCRFCAIVAGDEPTHVVFEDEGSLAFLDHRPLFPGHSLLVPREHHETIWDLPDELIGPLFSNARLLSTETRSRLPKLRRCRRSSMLSTILARSLRIA